MAVSESSALLSREPSSTEHDIETTILNKIALLYKRFSKYGDMVICHEGKGNWRKEIYPNYKKNRVTTKKKSSMDWDMLHRVFDKTYHDLHNFQWMNLKVNNTEADDLIATLSKCFSEKIMILSRDSDFSQLHIMSNIDQWDWVSKKPVVAKMTLHEKIIRGSPKENISNVKMDIDFISEQDGRQSSITKKFLNESLTTEQQKRYNLNRSLMDFNYIPDDIQQNIKDEYKSQLTRKIPSVMNMKMWLSKNKFRVLAHNVEDFIK